MFKGGIVGGSESKDHAMRLGLQPCLGRLPSQLLAQHEVDHSWVGACQRVLCFLGGRSFGLHMR